MNDRLVTGATLSAAVAYLIGIAWAMNNVAWDIWGALIVVPPMIVVTVLGVRRLFQNELEALVLPIVLGFLVKIGGSAVRYWIAFDAYGGATDAERYHVFASDAAGAVWRGETSVFSILPSGTGTEFVERTTSFIYTLVGSSKLAGFIMFGWLAYWGTLLFVKAACIAVPGLLQRRYAWLCVLAPSLVYWPSSIGKEALMMCFLGTATYGLARVLTRRGFLWPLLVSAAGLTLASLVRPHMAALWLVGVFAALLVALGRAFHPDQRRAGRGTDAVLLSVVVIIAAIALVVVGTFAMRYLQPRAADDEASVSEGITAILEETTRRSETGGSNFTPLVISGPRDWPYGVVRTLTRPLLIEVQGLFQLLSALEMTAFLGLCVLAWRRVVNAPRAIVSIPYVAFAMTALFVAGLAYTSFANLGILTRQKSLVIPLMALIPCLPLPKRRELPSVVEPERQLALVR